MTLTQIKPAGLSKPIDLANNEKIRLGDSQDLQIYHDGNTYIDNTNDTCDFRIQSDTIELKASSADEHHLKAVKDGAVTLYHNNVPKLETNSNGVNIRNSANSYTTISREANGYFGLAFNQGTTSYAYLGISGGGSEIGQYVGAGNHLVLRTQDHFSLYYGYNTRLITTDTNGMVGLYAGGVEKLTTNNNGVKITNTQSGFTSGALKINTDLANYGHIIVRDKNQTQTAALCVENESDATDANCHIYRAVDLASSAWANARAAALSHNFQITTDTVDSNVKLRVDSYGIKAAGYGNGNTQSTGIRVNTDILNYGVVSARDAHGEGSTNGSQHIACFQAENPGSGNNEVNIVTRSVNLNSAAWARARYVASEHEFAIGGNSSSNDVTATVASNGIRLKSGCGIDFSLTSNATQGSAANHYELLDDYEEGTWSPGVDKSASSMSGVSYSYSTGTYTRVGRMVTVWFDFNITSGGTSGSGNPYITELPFAALYGASSSVNNGGYGAPKFRDATLTHGDLRIYGNSSYIANSQIYLQHYNSSGNTTATSLNGSGRITGQATYFTS